MRFSMHGLFVVNETNQEHGNGGKEFLLCTDFFFPAFLIHLSA